MSKEICEIELQLGERQEAVEKAPNVKEKVKRLFEKRFRRTE